MKKIKALLYCCKAKPSLMKYENIDGYYTDTDPVLDKRALLNGTIVAECDFEVEEIYYLSWMNEKLRERILKQSCLTDKQFSDYMGNKDTCYALHISNLHIFDKPRELYDCLIHPKIESRYYGCEHLSKAPQNMMYVELDDIKYILISIKPKELCRILNGEQTILINKQVLNCMKGNK